MLRRIEVVMQNGMARQITFESHPIQSLNVVLCICFDGSEQFTIRDAVEQSPVGSDILSGLWQLNSYCRILLRSDNLARHLALTGVSLGQEPDGTEKSEHEHNHGSKQGSPQMWLPIRMMTTCLPHSFRQRSFYEE